MGEKKNILTSDGDGTQVCNQKVKLALQAMVENDLTAVMIQLNPVHVLGFRSKRIE